jgi:hypothetical protein
MELPHSTLLPVFLCQRILGPYGAAHLRVLAGDYSQIPIDSEGYRCGHSFFIASPMPLPIRKYVSALLFQW